VPRYRHIADDLARKIRSGSYAPGEALPAQRDLSTQYGVTLMTLRQALRQLSDEGLIVQQPGRGTFVAPPHLAYRLGSLRSLTDDLRDQGFPVHTTVISRDVADSPMFGAGSLRLERVREFAGRPSIHDDRPLHRPGGGRHPGGPGHGDDRPRAAGQRLPSPPAGAAEHSGLHQHPVDVHSGRRAGGLGPGRDPGQRNGDPGRTGRDRAVHDLVGHVRLRASPTGGDRISDGRPPRSGRPATRATRATRRRSMARR
jgi:hypothetical protein